LAEVIKEEVYGVNSVRDLTLAEVKPGYITMCAIVDED